MARVHPLERYLRERRMTRAEFGALVGSHDASVCRWIAGTRHPTLAVAVAIERVTAGAVPLEAWLSRRERRLKAA